MLADQSEASLRNSSPYAQYEQNMPCRAKTEKILQCAAWCAEDAALRFGLPLPQMYPGLTYRAVFVYTMRLGSACASSLLYFNGDVPPPEGPPNNVVYMSFPGSQENAS